MKWIYIYGYVLWFTEANSSTNTEKLINESDEPLVGDEDDALNSRWDSTEDLNLEPRLSSWASVDNLSIADEPCSSMNGKHLVE